MSSRRGMMHGMHCELYDMGRCSSCELMGVPYSEQRESMHAQVVDRLARHVDGDRWLPDVFGAEAQFRNKSKLVVGGRRGAPVLGIVGPHRQVVDLIECDLVEPPLKAALISLQSFIGELGLTPYDIARRTGELKNLLVTVSPDRELMVRFVFRSTGQVGRLRAAVPELQRLIPGVAVVSANLQPEHKAVLEGEVEAALTERQTLPMRLDPVTLYLRPGSFFQTNTAIATRLYRQAADWVGQSRPVSVLDLFCGVGGFALHAATATDPPDRVTGIEVSAPAIESARAGAAELVAATGIRTEFEFTAADAAAAVGGRAVPDLVIVNPPRRGIGPVADWLQSSEVGEIIYSSCNSASLATDLDRLPGFRVVAARLFHMFPQTRHHEVLVRLARR